MNINEPSEDVITKLYEKYAWGVKENFQNSELLNIKY